VNPGGAFLGAATGTPVIVCGFTRLCGRASEAGEPVEQCSDVNGGSWLICSSAQELTELWNSLLVQSHGKGMA
jgi:hypothetical protein